MSLTFADLSNAFSELVQGSKPATLGATANLWATASFQPGAYNWPSISSAVTGATGALLTSATTGALAFPATLTGRTSGSLLLRRVALNLTSANARIVLLSDRVWHYIAVPVVGAYGLTGMADLATGLRAGLAPWLEVATALGATPGVQTLVLEHEDASTSTWTATPPATAVNAAVPFLCTSGVNRSPIKRAVSLTGTTATTGNLCVSLQAPIVAIPGSLQPLGNLLHGIALGARPLRRDACVVASVYLEGTSPLLPLSLEFAVT